MILLVSGASATVRRYAHTGKLGQLLTPRNGDRAGTHPGLVWAADNDCFGGLNEKAYLKMLDKCAAAPVAPLWVTVPDVVADHAATRALFEVWLPELTRRGLPAAFVAQDGATVADIPWAEIAAVFIGGSTRWKLGAQSEQIIKHAKAVGKWVHVGRVNTPERLRHCVAIGVDSVDGSQFSRWGDTHIPWAVRLLQLEHKYLWHT